MSGESWEANRWLCPTCYNAPWEDCEPVIVPQDGKHFESPFGNVGEYFWCLHCEHVSTAKAWSNNHWDCPRPDCDGGALDCSVWSAFSWPRGSQIGKPIHPEYPDVPDLDVYYPLY